MEQQIQSSEQTQNVPGKKVWYKKWWVIGIGIFILYSIGNNSLDEAKKKADEAKGKAAQEQQPQETKPVQQEAQQPKAEVSESTKSNFVTAEGTLERKVEETVVGAVKEKANTGDKRIVAIEQVQYTAKELADSGYKKNEKVIGVTVKINGSENLTSNLTRSTMNKEAFAILKSVFPVSPEIGDVLVWTYFPMKDSYGKTENKVVMTHSMARPLFEKVNWDGLNYLDLPGLLKKENSADWRNNYVELVKF